MMTSRLCSATAGTLLTCPPLLLNKAASHSGIQKPHLSPTSLPSFLALDARLVDLHPIKTGAAVCTQGHHFPNDCSIKYENS